MPLKKKKKVSFPSSYYVNPLPMADLESRPVPHLFPHALGHKLEKLTSKSSVW